jgi:hypothetical protein
MAIPCLLHHKFKPNAYQNAWYHIYCFSHSLHPGADQRLISAQIKAEHEPGRKRLIPPVTDGTIRLTGPISHRDVFIPQLTLYART